MHHMVTAGVLDIAYELHGEANGWPVVLSHGFPYDVRCFDGVAAELVRHGAHVIVPYLRGYGPTRFRDAATPRSGQQAALGHDLLELLNALKIERAILGAYDWGGRAGCVCAALWPERVEGLVSGNGYNIQNIAQSGQPAQPEQEHRLWYQYYFHGARGVAGLDLQREAICRLLWSLWSPSWEFDLATYAASSTSFFNPDFVAVVIHSYRHRFGLVDGDPAYEQWEQALAREPQISVPAITLDGADDGVIMPQLAHHQAHHFSGPRRHRVISAAGHNLPQEAPEEFARAVLELHAGL